MFLLRRLALFAIIVAALIALGMSITRDTQVRKQVREHDRVVAEQKLRQSITSLRLHHSLALASLGAYIVDGSPNHMQRFEDNVQLACQEHQLLVSWRANSEVLQNRGNDFDLLIKPLFERYLRLMSTAAGPDAQELVRNNCRYIKHEGYGNDPIIVEQVRAIYRTFLQDRRESDLQRELARMEYEQLSLAETRANAFDNVSTSDAPLNSILKWTSLLLLTGGIVGISAAYILQRQPDIDLTSAALDTVTRLPTRQHLKTALNRAADKAERNTSRFGIICIDVNHFREVNETFGYEIGDQLLRKVAERIMRHVKEDDLLVRMPGDEFALLVYRRTKEAIDLLMTNLIAEMERPARIGDQVVGISSSLGGSIFPEEGRDADKLFDMAQERLDLMRKEQRKGLKVFRRTDEAISELKMTKPRKAAAAPEPSIDDLEEKEKQRANRRAQKEAARFNGQYPSDSNNDPPSSVPHNQVITGVAGVAGVAALTAAVVSDVKPKEASSLAFVANERPTLPNEPESAIDQLVRELASNDPSNDIAGSSRASVGAVSNHTPSAASELPTTDELPTLIEQAGADEVTTASAADLARLAAKVDPDNSLPAALSAAQVDRMAEHALNANWELHGDVNEALALLEKGQAGELPAPRDVAFDAPLDMAAFATEEKKLSPLEELARKLLADEENFAKDVLDVEAVQTATQTQLVSPQNSTRYIASTVLDGPAEQSASNRAATALNEAALRTEEVARQPHIEGVVATGATAELERWLKSLNEHKKERDQEQEAMMSRLNLLTADTRSDPLPAPVVQATSPQQGTPAASAPATTSPAEMPACELLDDSPDFLFDLREDGLIDGTVVKSPTQIKSDQTFDSALDDMFKAPVPPAAPEKKQDDAIALIRGAYSDLLDDGAKNEIDQSIKAVDNDQTSQLPAHQQTFENQGTFDPNGNPEKTFKLPDRPWVLKQPPGTPEGQAGAKLRERATQSFKNKN